jgi:hypothetical protein
MVDNNDRYKNIVNIIENLSNTEIEEIFKMIHKHGCSYTRNNNGLFINLAWMPEDLLNELEQYVKFCNRSQTELQKYESICHVLNINLKDIHKKKSNDTYLQVPKTHIPAVEIHEIDLIPSEIDIIQTEDDEIEKPGSKISSSMKYTLLKKKFAKISINNFGNIENDLKHEQYIIENDSHTKIE